jgi:hypothetical protein
LTIEVVVPDDLDELDRLLRGGPPLPPGTPVTQAQFPVYRGCVNAGWQLEHSLSRTNGDVAAKEPIILDQFKSRGAEQIALLGTTDPSVPLQLMALAQHFGAPTRLLDWSRNADAALHFATSDLEHKDTDGAVWMANPYYVHSKLSLPVRQFLCPQRVDDPEIISQTNLTNLYPTLADFDQHFVDGTYMPMVFFEPAASFRRIQAQTSLFSIVASPSVSAHRVLDWLDGSCKKIVIRAALKAELRRRLDNSGNHEAMYYPELEGVGQWLSRAQREPAP